MWAINRVIQLPSRSLAWHWLVPASGLPAGALAWHGGQLAPRTIPKWAVGARLHQLQHCPPHTVLHQCHTFYIPHFHSITLLNCNTSSKIILVILY